MSYEDKALGNQVTRKNSIPQKKLGRRTGGKSSSGRKGGLAALQSEKAWGGNSEKWLAGRPEKDQTRLITRFRQQIQHTQKRAAALKYERDLRETILENTKASLAMVDRNFNFLKVNSAYAKSGGFKKHELLGKNYFALFPDEKYRRMFEQACSLGRKVTYPRILLPFPSRSEKETYWDLNLVPVKRGGKIAGLVISCVDVSEDVHSDLEREQLLSQIQKEQAQTARKAAEASRHASELDAVFMALTDPVLIYDARGTLASFNPATLTMLGFDLIGKRFTKVNKTLKMRLLSGAPASFEDYLFLGAIRGKPVTGRIFLITTKTGTDIAVIASASPIINNNRVTGVAVTLHDISERLKLEQQKDEFIAIASHELKTPLTTLKALTQLFRQRSARPERQADYQYFSRFETYLNRLLELVTSLLDVSKVASDNFALKRKMFSFDKFLEDLVNDFQQTETTHCIEVKNSFRGKIYADRDHLAQVITNLLSNAIKYSPQSNAIIIKTTYSPHFLTISIKDFGVGIPDSLRERVFDRFFRIKGPKGERFPGLGLGLYIANKIVKLHGGRMWVRSMEGQGSVFYFSLPLKEVAQLRQPAKK